MRDCSLRSNLHVGFDQGLLASGAVWVLCRADRFVEEEIKFLGDKFVVDLLGAGFCSLEIRPTPKEG